MDISSLTPDTLKSLTLEQLVDELQRLTSEQRACLKPEQVAAVIETLDSAVRLVPDSLPVP